MGDRHTAQRGQPGYQTHKPEPLLGQADIRSGNKDKEVPASLYNNSIIQPEGKLQFNACGRENGPESGTTGDFDVVDPLASDKIIRHFYWDCPWNPATGNTWTISQANPKWLVESSGGEPLIIALGVRTVAFRNIDKPALC